MSRSSNQGNYPPISGVSQKGATNYGKFDNLNVDPSLNSNNNNELTTILKDKYTLSYSDYEKQKIAEQYNRLYIQSKEENEGRNKLKTNQKIYNLSLSELVKNASLVYMNVLNELIIFFTNPVEKKDWNKFVNIFVNSDNMIYVGLLIVMIAFALWVIDVTQ
jgi:hypothetical protein